MVVTFRNDSGNSRRALSVAEAVFGHEHGGTGSGPCGECGVLGQDNGTPFRALVPPEIVLYAVLKVGILDHQRWVQEVEHDTGGQQEAFECLAAYKDSQSHCKSYCVA